ncbi:MAG TPA: STELLO glycosyltransferase family protein [Chthoniobacterales bacterium]|jgi:hypothetical protein
MGARRGTPVSDLVSLNQDSGRPAIVVTSISAPSRAMQKIAQGAADAGYDFIVIGDARSPSDFHSEGCDYYDLPRQRTTGLKFAEVCPMNHYARKNIGYLLAIRVGASLIIETDDDNSPQANFWRTRRMKMTAPVVKTSGWVNVYRYFTQELIWPRGLPLDAIQQEVPAFDELPAAIDCPIQQGLADENPDLDAVYRLTLPLPRSFRKDIIVALAARAWCPFNSQNTAWWPPAYPLLYLPSYCSFRMTDIWRSFVAQRIAWENNWNIIFQSPDVSQNRNPHNLMRDFEDEVPGYLHNRAIASTLDCLSLKRGTKHTRDNLRRCYLALVRGGWMKEDELCLMDVWLDDLKSIVSA